MAVMMSGSAYHYQGESSEVSCSSRSLGTPDRKGGSHFGDPLIDGGVHLLHHPEPFFVTS